MKLSDLTCRTTHMLTYDYQKNGIYRYRLLNISASISNSYILYFYNRSRELPHTTPKHPNHSKNTPNPPKRPQKHPQNHPNQITFILFYVYS